ncbi:MAG TPA: hypothetical protein VHL85_03360 [Burkholderiales bacterium]|nr:hypothetical protein [Burkholderiales bacterium]
MKLQLWQKFWLVFTVIWVVVAGLNAATILAFSEGPIEREKAVQPILYGLLVPVAVYLAAWGWVTLRSRARRPREK